MTEVMTTAPPRLDATAIERVLLHGDLRQLTSAQKLAYYNRVCDELGLNPLTQPFAYIVLNNKEILYAKREATEQLRKVHGISVAILTREVIEGVYVVTARATMPTGRQDESTGAVWIDGLKGENRANAMLKSETKAKRRVTLSICGLGMLDETEVDSIPGARNPTKPNYIVEAPPALDTPMPTETDVPGPLEATAMAQLAMNELAAELVPEGCVRIAQVQAGGPGTMIGRIVTHQGEELPVYSQKLLAACEQWCQDGTIIELKIVISRAGKPYLHSAVPATAAGPTAPPTAPLTAGDMPF